MINAYTLLLVDTIVADESVDIWDKTIALNILNDRGVESEQDYKAVIKENPSGKPAVAPPTYTPKPPEDDTPQWIWDHYKNGGRTS